MTLNFLDRVSEYIITEESSKGLPKIAIQGIEENYESESLILIAGLSVKESQLYGDDYLKKMLDELNVDLTTKNKAALFLVKSVSKKILESQIDVYLGCDYIFNHVLSLTDFRKQDIKFVYDSIRLAEVYSFFINIEELRDTSEKWDKIKTNEQLINETKENIKLCFYDWINQLEH
jgi:hypothetical protein